MNPEFNVKRQRRKTLAIHIMDDASVEVRAPKWVPLSEIQYFVAAKREWIASQIEKKKRYLAAKPGFYQGQQHPFLGRAYPIHWQPSSQKSLQLKSDHWLLSSSDENPQLWAKQFEQWYRQQALSYMPERLRYCFRQLPWQPFPAATMPELRLRKMKSRWGSCNQAGRITLNTLLMKYSPEVIDSVIYHELCHLWEFNHSDRFYRLLTTACPQWKAAARELGHFD